MVFTVWNQHYYIEFWLVCVGWFIIRLKFQADVLTLDMPDSGGHKATGRALPSWMSSRDADNKSDRKEPANDTDKRPSGSSISTNKSPKLMVWVGLYLYPIMCCLVVHFLDNNFNDCRKGLCLCFQGLLTPNAARYGLKHWKWGLSIKVIGMPSAPC